MILVYGRFLDKKKVDRMDRISRIVFILYILPILLIFNYALFNQIFTKNKEDFKIKIRNFIYFLLKQNNV